MSLSGALRSSLCAAMLLASACAPAGGSPAAGDANGGSAEASTDAVRAVAAAAVPLTGAADDYAKLMPAMANARFVLLGESTHGTREYYRERARISEQLIREQGFGAIAIEGDWTPTLRVDRYVRGLGSDRNAEQALSGYTRFPRWMWRNAEFGDFVERVRAHNLTLPAERRVGIYGMDVYDLDEAAGAVIAHLRQVDPASAVRAQRHLRCFSRYRGDTHAYGEASRSPARSCQEEAAAAQAEVLRLPRPASAAAAEAHFGAVRSAASVVAAEEYFRTVYAGSMAWNVRDQRMSQNVHAIADHAAALSGRPGKVVVWSHNTHSGDARATFAANRGELNLGQLLRQRHGNGAFLLGFFSYAGKVMAAPDWDQPNRVYDMRPALPGSYSALFHQAGVPNFSLLLRGNRVLSRQLGGNMLERAIGVIYRPETERQSHYFEARLAGQFDAAIFFDRSSAVRPLR